MLTRNVSLLSKILCSLVESDSKCNNTDVSNDYIREETSCREELKFPTGYCRSSLKTKIKLTWSSFRISNIVSHFLHFYSNAILKTIASFVNQIHQQFPNHLFFFLVRPLYRIYIFLNKSCFLATAISSTLVSKWTRSNFSLNRKL